MSEHSVHVDRLGTYTISLHVEGVSDEHAAYVAQSLFILQRLFTLEGSGVGTELSAHKAGDPVGVERIYDLIPDHG